MRRKRESSAVMHGSQPLVVQEVDPVDMHPSLGPLRRRKALRLARAAKATKTKVKVEVKVGGDDGAA